MLLINISWRRWRSVLTKFEKKSPVLSNAVQDVFDTAATENPEVQWSRPSTGRIDKIFVRLFEICVRQDKAMCSCKVKAFSLPRCKFHIHGCHDNNPHRHTFDQHVHLCLLQDIRASESCWWDRLGPYRYHHRYIRLGGHRQQLYSWLYYWRVLMQPCHRFARRSCNGEKIFFDWSMNWNLAASCENTIFPWYIGAIEPQTWVTKPHAKINTAFTIEKAWAKENYAISRN